MEKKKWLNYPDYIRLIAAFMVVAYHFEKAYLPYEIHCDTEILPSDIFSCDLGNMAVSLFFIISGLSLMYVYGDRDNIRDYYRKRFLSIYPLFWISYLFVFVWKCLRHTMNFSYPYIRFLYSFFAVDSYVRTMGGVFEENYFLVGEWFLGCILLMYLLFPLLKRGISRKPVLTAVILAAVWLLTWKFWKLPMRLYWVMMIRLPEFAFGMYFVRYIKKVPGAAAAVSAGFLCFMEFMQHAFPHSLSITEAILYTPAAGVALFLVLTFLFSGIRSEKADGAAKYLSQYTYAVFLIHHTVIYFLMNRFAGQTFSVKKAWGLFFLCSFLIAVASFFLFHVNRKVLSSIKLFRK